MGGFGNKDSSFNFLRNSLIKDSMVYNSQVEKVLIKESKAKYKSYIVDSVLVQKNSNNKNQLGSYLAGLPEGGCNNCGTISKFFGQKI